MKERNRNRPQWRDEWDTIVGENKFFRIKNWDRYQPTLAASGNGVRWIKDYCEKDFDLSEWSLMERWLMDALRRWRGRRGENILADVTAMSRATNAPVASVSGLPRAVLALVSRGILIPCNESDSPLDKSRVEKKREETPNPQDDGLDDSDQEEKPKSKPAAKVKPVSPSPVVNKSPQKRCITHGTNFDSGISQGCYSCQNITGRETESSPVSSAAAKVTPLAGKVAGFDIDSWDEDISGYPAAEVRRVLLYHRKKNTWDGQMLKQADSPAAWLRKGFERMALAMPKDFNPNATKTILKADPQCPHCKGRGEVTVPNPQYKSGILMDVDCECVTPQIVPV